jgi:hypothetical protein
MASVPVVATVAPGRHVVVDVVIGDVVIEAAAHRHALDDFRQLLLGVAVDLNVPENAVVPVVVADELIVPKRIGGIRRVDRAEARGFHDPHGFPIPAAANLEVAAAADEVVLERIQGKQHAHAPLGICVQDHQVPVVLRLHVDPEAVTEIQVLTSAQPDLDRRVLDHTNRCGNGRRCGVRNSQGDQKCGQHDTSNVRRCRRFCPSLPEQPRCHIVASCVPRRKLLFDNVVRLWEIARTSP